MKKPKIKITLVSSPVVAHTKKLSCRWTLDESQEFKGEILKNLRVGKKVVFDCLGPTEFVVDFIDEKGYAYLRSIKTCNIATKISKNTWETDWSFYSLDAAKQMGIWFDK